MEDGRLTSPSDTTQKRFQKCHEVSIQNNELLTEIIHSNDADTVLLNEFLIY